MLMARSTFAAAGCCLLVFLGTVGTCAARSIPANPGSGDATATAYLAQAERAPAQDHVVTIWPSQPVPRPRMAPGAELRRIAGLAFLELGLLSLLFLGGRQCGHKASRRKRRKRDWHLPSALIPDEFEQREKFGALGERKSTRKHLLAACFLAIICSSLPARAIDCTKASQPDEKAICADPVLKAADERLNETYRRVWHERGPADRRGLEALQEDWISARRFSAFPADKLNRQYLLEEIGQRRELLERGEGVGPDKRGRLTYITIDVPADDEKKEESITIHLFKFSRARTAGERLFNSHIENSIDNLDGYTSKELIRSVIKKPQRVNDAGKITLNIFDTFLSDSFISVVITYWEYSSGMAHGMGTTTYVNIDLEHGIQPKLEDLFERSHLSQIALLCRKNLNYRDDIDGLNVDVRDDNGTVSLSETFLNTAQSIDSWTFSETHAEIDFGLYLLGSYEDGIQSCTLPYADLRPFLKRGKVLPP
jgi:Lysozyme inhibitor LprI